MSERSKPMHYCNDYIEDVIHRIPLVRRRQARCDLEHTLEGALDAMRAGNPGLEDDHLAALVVMEQPSAALVAEDYQSIFPGLISEQLGALHRSVVVTTASISVLCVVAARLAVGEAALLGLLASVLLVLLIVFPVITLNFLGLQKMGWVPVFPGPVFPAAEQRSRWRGKGSVLACLAVFFALLPLWRGWPASWSFSGYPLNARSFLILSDWFLGWPTLLALAWIAVFALLTGTRVYQPQYRATVYVLAIWRLLGAGLAAAVLLSGEVFSADKLACLFRQGEVAAGMVETFTVLVINVANFCAWLTTLTLLGTGATKACDVLWRT
ncbi:hypothetical protein [Stenotrophomonas sp.]|uniref:hypothetical protein n=1 Tax=Stenotrophomonas sp. TaxID=69392 RepID=UPI0028A82614|nr:hypothetical protein [Stenotrophomonas sp.]